MKTKNKIDSKHFLLLGLVIVVALMGALIRNVYFTQIGILVFVYAMWASAWNLVGGYTGQTSLGHAMFVGIGAYTSTLLVIHFNLSPWIGMLVGGLLAGILGVMIGYPCFKLRGSYLTLSTTAILTVIRTVFVTEKSILGIRTEGASGLKVPWKGTFAFMQFFDKRGYYFIALGLLIVTLLISYYIKKSKMGYYLAAINSNQEAAGSLGINVLGMKLKVMFISAFIAAVGGSFYVQFLQFVDPNGVFAYDLSVTIMLLAVVGGRGTLWGPVLGAVILVPMNELLRGWLGSQLAGLSFVIYGLVMMIIIFFFQKGLLGIVEMIKSAVVKAIKGNKGNVETKSV